MTDEQAVPPPSPPEDAFSAMLRDMLRAIDTRIERVVAKHVETAMAEYRVNGLDADAVATIAERAVQRAIEAEGLVGEDTARDIVRDEISDAFANASVELRYRG